MASRLACTRLHGEEASASATVAEAGPMGGVCGAEFTAAVMSERCAPVSCYRVVVDESTGFCVRYIRVVSSSSDTDRPRNSPCRSR